MNPADDDASDESARRAVTERIEREEFARGNIGENETPAEPRPAATLVLGRDGTASGFEVLLLKRPSTSRFAAGAHVFPGGKIDGGDADSELGDRMPIMGSDAEPAAVLAALRELFEETGLLLSDDPLSPDIESRVREQLLSDTRTFGDVAREHDLRFSKTRVCYFARWITPTRFARRYDTRFFLVALPPAKTDFVPSLTDEIADYAWMSPQRAVDLFGSGRLPMLYPTRVTLQALAGFAELSEAFATYSKHRVEPVTPRLLIHGDSIRPVLPGDPAYDEAIG